jgi:hypothetical protein
MSRIGATADRLLALVVPQLSAAADDCGWNIRWYLCYTINGLKYSKKCGQRTGSGRHCDVVGNPCGGGLPGILLAGCQPVG